MIRRVILAFAAVLSTSMAYSGPLSSCAQLATWGSRGIPTDLAIRGNRVYAADGRGVTSYDVSNPSLIRQVVARDSRYSTAIGLHGDDVVLLTRSTIELYDAADLRPLTYAGIITSHLATDDAHIITAGTDIISWRVDENGKLQQVARVIPQKPIDAIALAGNTLVTTEHGGLFRLYDLSGGKLTPLGAIAVPAVDLLVHNDIVYAAGGPYGLSVVDISDRQKPRLVTTLSSTDTNYAVLTIAGSRLFATDRLAAIAEFDITNPRSPVLVSSRLEPVDTIAGADNTLFASGVVRDRAGKENATGSPLRMFNVRGDGTLTLQGEFTDRAGAVTGVAVDANFAYVADPPLLRVIDLRPVVPQQIASLDYGDTSDRVRLFGRWLVVYGRTAAHLIDVSNPSTPTYTGIFPTRGTIPDFVTFAGPYLIESNRGSGFHVLDLTNPAVPTQISGLKNDGFGQWQAVAGLNDVVYGVVGTGIKIVDLSNPHAAKVAKVVPVTSPIDVALITARATPLLVVLDDATVRFYDISSRFAPVEVGSIEVFRGTELTVDGTTVYLVSPYGAVARIDASDPTAPTVIADGDFASPTQLAAANGRVVVADRYMLRVLRDVATIHDATTPQLALERTPNGLPQLVWSGDPSLHYEIQTATNSDFSDADSETVVGNRATETSGQYFRVRQQSGCEMSAWSNVVSPSVSTEPEITFIASGRALYVTPSTTAQHVRVGLRNAGASAATVAFTASEGIEAPASVVVPPHNGTEIDIVVDPNAAKSDALTLTAAGTGSHYDITLHRVSASEHAPAAADALLLPGVGSTPGAAGTRWKSELQLFCRAADGCDLTVGYLPQSSNLERSVTLHIEPRAVMTIDDFVASLFGATDTAGMARITSSDLRSIAAAAYTYNDSPSGRFGQRIPAVLTTTPSNSKQLLLGISQNATMRTNIGVANPTAVQADVLVRLRGSDGSELGAKNLVVAPFTSAPLFVSDLLPAGGSVTLGTASVESNTSVVSYASAVDQRTGDGTFSYGTAAPSALASPAAMTRVGVFDAAGSIRGAGGSNWRTSLQLVNTSTSLAQLKLTFIPIVDATRSVTHTLSLGPNAAFGSEDVMSSLFGDVSAELRGSGTIRVESKTTLAGWGRLYNDTTAGTYGQFIPLRDASLANHLTGSVLRSGAKSVGSPAAFAPTMFPVGDSNRYRTNLGLVETSGKLTAVRVTVYSADGAVIDASDVLMQPYESKTMLGYLASRGLAGADDLHVEIEPRVDDGRVEAYASVVDNGSNDAVTIPAE